MTTLRQGLEKEQVRLLALLASLSRALELGEERVAHEASIAFARRLRRALCVEEEVLFPAIEHVVQQVHYAATHASRAEHAVFRGLLDDIEADIGHGSLLAAAGNVRELDCALRLHQSREADVLHPMLERILQPTTILDMAAMIQP
jgi:hypothetical protein